MKFPESDLAHRWLDGLDGIEVGGSAHNPFNIPGCRNVDYTDDPGTIFKAEERRICGESLPVDVVDEGDRLATFADGSLGYVLSSHVFEHFPNPLQALLNWARVLRDGGLIYLVVPHRDALEADAGRPLTTWEEALQAFLDGVTVDTAPVPEGHGVRGHYRVYSLESLTEIVGRFDRAINGRLSRAVNGRLSFEIVDSLERDDKVGNGFVLVLRVHKRTWAEAMGGG